MDKELVAIIGELMKLMQLYYKCTLEKCKNEKDAVSSDNIAKYINNTNINNLKKLSKKEQDKKINEWTNNKTYLKLEKCRYNKCNEITKKLINTVINLTIKMKEKNNKNLTEYEDKFLKEFSKLLKIQNIKDKELRKIIEYTFRLELIK